MCSISFNNNDKSTQEALLKNPLWFYIRQNKRNFALGMFFLLLTNGLDAAYPLVLKEGIDRVVARAPFAEILPTGVLFFAILMTLAGTRYAWRSYFGAYHTDSAEDLRRRLFAHLTRLSPSFFQKNPTGEIMSLIMSDIQAFRNGIGSSILMLVDAVIILSFIIPFMLHLNASWTLKCLIFFPLVPFFIRYITGKMFALYKKQQDLSADWSGYSQESVAGARILKSFGLEDSRTRIHDFYSRKVEDAANATARLDSLFMPIMTLGASSGTIILLLIAGQDVISGSESIGTLVAFQRYLIKVNWPVTAFGYGTSQYQKGMASFSRIRKVLETPSEIPDHGTQSLNNFQDLQVQNLTYSIGELKILENVNFQLKKGQSLGIVGAVGSGKTTLLNLLCRFLEATTGSIKINGNAIQDYRLESLRNQMNLISQEPFLFSESIEKNLFPSSGQLHSAALAEEALVQVDLWEEVRQLPNGSKSQLGERGVNLSGGQKQRLSLARGMNRPGEILILDDVLSAVDSKTELRLIDSLNKDRRTRIVVSHKVSAVKDCDQILVLEAGKQVAIGKHHELIAKSTYYREIASLQTQNGGHRE